MINERPRSPASRKDLHLRLRGEVVLCPWELPTPDELRQLTPRLPRVNDNANFGEGGRSEG